MNTEISLNLNNVLLEKIKQLNLRLRPHILETLQNRNQSLTFEVRFIYEGY